MNRRCVTSAARQMLDELHQEEQLGIAAAEMFRQSPSFYPMSKGLV
jgi:hypothetical protein